MTKGLKIAVTGANGFVGRHVLKKLLEYDDIKITATTRNYKNLIEFSDKIDIIEFDMGKSDEKVYAELGAPNVLLHLAWGGLPNYDSAHHFGTELNIQYSFLERMIRGGLGSLVVTGTCFEYGMQSGPLSEELETKPSNPYGFAKDSLRKQLGYLQQKSSFNFTWARLFYLYGDGQPNSSLLPQLKAAVKSKASHFNMSGGAQLRDYLAVQVVAEYLVLLAFSQKNLGVLNVSSGCPISVRDLVEKWIKEYNFNIELNLGVYSYPDYEPLAFWGVNNKLAKILNGSSRV